MRSPVVAAMLGASLLLAACGHGARVTAAVGTNMGLTAARQAPGRALVRWRDPGARQALVGSLHLDAPDPIGVDGDELVTLASGQSLAEFKRLAGAAALSVTPDYLMSLPVLAAADAAGEELTASAKSARGNKSSTRKQYALDLVHASNAWRVTRGSPGVKIAIIDSGVDEQHPDLRGQIAASAAMGGLKGWLGVGSARDDHGHGTHCAGVAAASGAQGVSGLAPGCKLLIAKALNQHGEGDTASIARGVSWAIAQGASVISMSMGGEEDAPALRSAIARAIAHGIVVVAAMGNEGKLQRNFPAAYPGVIAVGATTSQDRVASYSTRGDWIDVCAPGTGILSTTPGYGVTLNDASEGGLEPLYGKLTGTSMATPLVAGLAALVRSAHPDYGPAEVQQAIERGARALDSEAPNRAGHGRIDAAATLGGRATGG